jgi:biopolymer transport protein ExbB
MLANLVFETFEKGGPVMWPLLLTLIAALAVVFERTLWWLGERKKRDADRLEQLFAAVESGNIEHAKSLTENTQDVLIRALSGALGKSGAAVQRLLQSGAAVELERASRFLPVLDTIITLAPLLGLLGTVTGIMHSFKFVGNEELAAVKVSGGIGEALIATAFGLGIAIFALIPFNFFNTKVTRLQFELETALTHLEIALDSPHPPAAAENRDNLASGR